MKLSGARVLVTGADGFIGSHLAEALVRAGCSVRAMALYNSFGSWGWVEDVAEDVTSEVEVVLGDVRDPRSAREACAGRDIVFHLAALIAIPYSFQAPASYVDTNVTGTLNVLEAARDLATPLTVVTSTSEVYGTARRVPIDEAHPLQGQSPYSASKIGADKIAESFSLSFGLPVITARPFNTYGPRQSSRAVVPTIATQLLSGEKSIHLGSLHPTRDMNYVTDTCAGFLALAACDAAVGHTVNIGSGVEVSIGDIAQKLIESIAPDADIVLDEQRVRPAGSEVHRLLCDNTLIRELTGWEPEVTLDEGLARTVEWLSDPANLARHKPHLYSV